MKKNILYKQNGILKGFSLIEVILSVAILAMLTTTYMTSILDNELSIFSNVKRNTPNDLAKEGLDAVYNIKENNFANLVDGNYGLSETGNQISLTPSNDTKNNFTRIITISSINPKLKKIDINISWQEVNGRNNNLNLVTYLSDHTI